MQLGIDVLLNNRKIRSELSGKKIGILAHPASHISSPKAIHTMDALAQIPDINLVAAFGPQHGIRGEKQDNMMESENDFDSIHKIPIFSLYGETRRITPLMLAHFDILFIDLQDIGTRIYTFLTTLFYLLEDLSKAKKSIWILDRPNPAGRPIEGSLLEEGYFSFVGGARIPMRHGLTLGEAARWFIKNKNLNIECRVIAMENYHPSKEPGYGWPIGKLPWINPSPNAASLSMARCFPGTVLLEGTTLSEGRGTTHPLEILGAPNLNPITVLKKMEEIAPEWMVGCKLRPCSFEPTFQKHLGKLCNGFQIHVDDQYYIHDCFKPYRLIALTLKSIQLEYPHLKLWREFTYEYETDRLAIDLISGSSFLRNWVEDPESSKTDLEERLIKDETFWHESRVEHLLY